MPKIYYICQKVYILFYQTHTHIPTLHTHAKKKNKNKTEALFGLTHELCFSLKNL